MTIPDRGKDKGENRAEAQSSFRRFQHTGPFRLLVRGFLAATKYLPVWFLRTAGLFFVGFFAILNFKNYRAIRKNLARISPGLTAYAYSRMAYRVFRDFSFYLIDLFYLSHDLKRLEEYTFTISGNEHLEQALSCGKGIILLTAHLGNWEIGSLKLGLKDRKVHVVYSPDSSALLESQRSLVRDAQQVEEIRLQEGAFSSLRLLRILREGGIIALQGDRLTFDSGVAVDFFGSPALLPKGPVKLAMVSDSILLPAFIPICGYKSYRIVVEEPVVMDKGEAEPDVWKTNLNKIIKILEKNIRAYPTQWFSFMPFWEEDKKKVRKAP